MTAKKTTSKTTPKTGKVFILDTSVILHDPGCIYNFEKHDIVIPIHVVDKLRFLKKDLNYNQAIDFCRTLDSLTKDNVFWGYQNWRFFRYAAGTTLCANFKNYKE